MKKPMVRIAGIENYFPKKVVTNHDLEKLVDTNHDWIVERTGIVERRLSEKHETPGFMGSAASKALLERLRIAPTDIDLILVATITGDYCFPATACIIQNAIGASRAWGYDLSAACSGYLYGLETARAFIESGRAKNVLFVAAEKMSSILNYEDRTTCVLFGDAATASLITASEENSGIIDSVLKMDGSGLPCLFMPAGGSLEPPSEETVKNKLHFVMQEGRSVYKRAVTDMGEVCVELLQRNGLKAEDLKLFVPHQANLRIIESAAERMHLPKEKIALNIQRYGNTTAATIPSALAEHLNAGELSSGDLVLLASFGAGFTWGATLLRI
jgi:3-oxoacyl-[acyl-carrier-protein] synthase-3